jgi:hypothetical protein
MKRRGQKFRLQQIPLPLRAVPATTFTQRSNQLERKNNQRENQLMTRANADLDELFNDGIMSHKTFQSISRVMSLYSAVQTFVNSAWGEFSTAIKGAAQVK